MNERGTFVEVMLQGPTGDWAWMVGEVSRDQERPPEAEAGCLPGREGGREGGHQSLHQRHEPLLRSHEGGREVVMAIQSLAAAKNKL